MNASPPPSAPQIGPTLYEKLGGEPALRALISAFYDIIEQAPQADPLHRLHLRGSGVANARIEQFDFLSGFLGGPRLYVERHGHSHLKQIHQHVPIDAAMSSLWLDCMSRALEAANVAEALRPVLMRHFSRAAAMVVNQAG